MRHIWIAGILVLPLLPNLTAHAQAPTPLPPGIQSTSGTRDGPSQPPERYPQYTDLDLAPSLTRRAARVMTVQVHVRTRGGAPVSDLNASDFHLTANGRPREVRISSPVSSNLVSGEKDLAVADRAASLETAPATAVVLIILPPNQQRVRLFMLHDAIQTFTARAADAKGNLGWSVSIFDGKQTSYFRKKADLLAALEQVRHVTPPILLITGPGSSGQRWLDEATRAIVGMQNLSSNRIVIVCNPEPGEVCPFGSGVHENELCPSPLFVLSTAESIGAQVFVANSGGPSAAIDLANTSGMMQTAADSGGGYSNSFQSLANQVDNALLASYELEFHLDADEIDAGPPAVSVTVRDTRLVASVELPRPAPEAGDIENASLKPLSDALVRSLGRRVTSPALVIHQRVDYFPIRKGAAPILPMTCTIEWKADRPPPESLDVIETVEHAETGMLVLSRRLNVKWNGQAVSWERDGQLIPGAYIWRVAAGDPKGNTVASATFQTRLNPPGSEAINLSTLVAGKSCRNEHEDTTTAQPVSNATSLLKRRPAGQPETAPPPNFDPMIENGCRIEPEPTTHYSSADTLRSFVRVYIDQAIDKGKLQAWSGKFTLHAASGAVESEFPAALVADSQPGYLAALDLPLSGNGITPGAHTLTFELRGPHIRVPLTRSIEVAIDPLPR